MLWGGLLVLWVACRKDSFALADGYRAWRPAWAGLTILGLGGLLFSPVPWLAAGEILHGASLLFAAVFAYRMGQSRPGRQAIFGAVALSALAAATLALAQRAGLLTAWFPAFDHYDQPMYSVFGNEGLLGGYLALGLVMIPGLLGTAPRRMQVALVLAATVMLTALLISGSRAGQLSLLVGLLPLILVSGRQERRWGWLLCALSLMTAMFWVVTGGGIAEKWMGLMSATDVGGQVRVWIWRASLAMFVDHPFGGVGIGNFRYEVPQYLGQFVSAHGGSDVTYHAHLDMLEFLCENGILGLVFLAWQLKGLRCLDHTALSGFISLAVFSCFFPVLSSVPHALAAVLLLGINLQVDGEKQGCGRSGLPPGLAQQLVGLALIACFLLHTFTVLRPSFQLRRAEDIHIAGGDANAAYLAAIAGFGFRGEAHESYGIYLLEQGDAAAAWDQLRAAQAEMDTWRLYYLLSWAAADLGEVEFGVVYEEAARVRLPVAPGLVNRQANPGVADSEHREE